MTDFFQFVVSQTTALSSLEACAVLLAIAYLILAVKENILCWYCALFSTAIYIFLFWNVSLLMESALNVYYLIMAVYGWQQWKFGGKNNDGVKIRTLGLKQNAMIIVFILMATIFSGWVLKANTSAAWPYVDSFTTWGSVATTIMVARKFLENWLYWLVIDSISIPLYIDRGLYLTAFLFMIYIIIVIIGYMRWSRLYQSEQNVMQNA